MPRLTLVMERNPVKVYDVDSSEVTIGRGEGLDIRIDNVSVSRRQAQIRREGAGGWAVKDLGSANGTFLNGERLTAPRPLMPGDEISFGKFSLFFEREIHEPIVERAAPSSKKVEPAGTFYLHADEVEHLQRTVARKRKAQLRWEVGGAADTFYLDGLDRGALLVGRSHRCDLRVPAGPRHHVLITRTPNGYEVRNLSRWYRMRVNGHVRVQSPLRNSDVVTIGKLRLTFADELS
jgi:FHA domain